MFGVLFVLGQNYPLFKLTLPKNDDTSQRHGAHGQLVGRLVLYGFMCDFLFSFRFVLRS